MAGIDWTWVQEKKIPSDVGSGTALIQELLARLEQESWSTKEIFAIHMAMEEAIMNAIKHGNDRDASKYVEVVIRLRSDRLCVHVTDEGAGFDPDSIPDCTQEENLEKTCGRGLLLMNTYMDSVEFNPTGNSVKLVKTRKSLPAPESESGSEV